MNPFEMVIGIILIVMASRVIQTFIRTRADAPTANPAETVQLRADVQALKERVQVLERVVTDNHGSIDLEREIARLRDR